jgi:hypothetical protein
MGLLDWFISDSKTASPSELAAEAESIRQREAELNQRRLEMGYYSPDQYDAAESRSMSKFQNTQVGIASIADEFSAGNLAGNLGESATKAGRSVGSVLGNIAQASGNFVGNTLLGFPVWTWLLVAAVAFFYLGGGNLIRARVARAAA